MLSLKAKVSVPASMRPKASLLQSVASNKGAPVPSPLGGILADDFIAVLITTVATRLSRGSTNFYRARWDIGMQDWRVLLVLARTQALNVGSLACAAGLDKAAVSRSLSMLKNRGIVDIEQTRSRGRAVFATLTPAGRRVCAEILQASRDRQDGLFTAFPKKETDALATMLRRFAQALDEVGWDDAP
jgi:DNA-binding MarR family transcriptional regulator